MWCQGGKVILPSGVGNLTFGEVSGAGSTARNCSYVGHRQIYDAKLFDAGRREGAVAAAAAPLAAPMVEG